jgi:hypothetical protein
MFFTYSSRSAEEDSSPHIWRRAYAEPFVTAALSIVQELPRHTVAPLEREPQSRPPSGMIRGFRAGHLTQGFLAALYEVVPTREQQVFEPAFKHRREGDRETVKSNQVVGSSFAAYGGSECDEVRGWKP